MKFMKRTPSFYSDSQCARGGDLRGARLALTLVLAAIAHFANAAPMPWSQLPPIPDAEGFAAPFAGVSGGALIVAGGANIPENKWGDVFVKKWYDSVFVLEKPGGEWRRAGKLPRALGYGVSVTWKDRVICIGGSDADRHYREVFALEWKDGAIHTSALPELPRACANACGALVGSVIYVAGGIETPTATTAMNTLFAIDLEVVAPIWRELPRCPGPARMLAVAGAQGGLKSGNGADARSASPAFFLFSGVALTAGPDGKPVREYLRDAWSYSLDDGWRALAEMPRAAVAAPGPAATLDDGSMLIFSGDDGANVNFSPVEKHPGFPRTALRYDRRHDRWSAASDVPFSLATAPTTLWQSRIVIPNGEVRPRVRTPEVWSLEIP